MADGKRLLSRGFKTAVPARLEFSEPADMTGIAKNPEAAASALPHLGIAWSMFLYCAARLLKAPHIKAITVEYEDGSTEFNGHRYTLES